MVETVQADGICTQVLAPAPDLDPHLAAVATEAGLRIAENLGVTGVFAVEMFEVRDPETGSPSYVVNELAMRPTTAATGAWTGRSPASSSTCAPCSTCPSEPRPREPYTVMANVLGGDYPELYPAYRHLMARDPALKVHLYGKDVRPGRKIGHVNVSGSDLEDLRERAGHAADYLAGVVTE